MEQLDRLDGSDWPNRMLFGEWTLGFVAFAFDGRILEANATYLEKSGYQREQLLALRISDIEANQSLEATRSRIERLKESGWDVFRTTHKKQDGTEWLVEINATFSPIDGGTVNAFVRDLATTDLLARLLQTRLQLSQIAFSINLDDLLQRTLDAAEQLTGSAIGFCHLVDPDQQRLTLTAWSKNTLRHMCQADGKGTHYPITDAGVWAECFHRRRPVIHDDYPSLAHRKGMPDGHAPVQRELVVPVIHGDLVTMILGVGNKPTSYSDTDVHIVDSLAHLVMDVVERKRAEELFLASEQRYLAVIDGFDGAVYVSSADDSLEFMNQRLVEQLGRSAVGEKCYRALYGADSRCTNCAKSRLGAGETCVSETRTDAAGRTFSVVNTLMRRDGGGDSMQVMLRDITESRRNEEQRLELERKVQRLGKFESLGALAGGIAHDFNNILTSILGYTELAIAASPADGQTQDDLEQIRVATRRAAELCTQMLAYSGRARFLMRSCRLDNLVRETCAGLVQTLPKWIDLQVNVGTTGCVIHGDPEQLSQMLTSLVANALEAIGSTAGKVSVEVSRTYFDRSALAGALFGDDLRPDEYFVIRVSDDGCGMDPATLAQIYDPFFTTKFAGRGLGIPAALGIARAHQGTILFESQPNRGTVARILIPACARAMGDVAVEVVAAVESRKTNRWVLLVDDDEAVRLIGKRSLEHAGYGVVLARDGIDALVAFARRSAPIDLVVLDVTMPQLDGIETLRALRALDPAVPVIMTSGYDSSDVSSRLRDMGPLKFLQKPFAPRDLREIVSETLEARS